MPDFVREYAAAKEGYLRKRGGVPSTGKKNRSTGQVLVPPPKLVPMTTWGDAMALWLELHRIAEPTIEQCTTLLAKEKGLSRNVAVTACQSGFIAHTGERVDFVRTPTFVRAKRDFDAQSPLARVGFNALTLAQNVRSGLFYPHNEELWGYADDYVLARAGAGAVPFKMQIVSESVVEAAKALPAAVRDAMNAVADAVSPGGFLDDLKEVVKWSAIGGGLFMLYWYVLRPKRQS